MHGEDSWVAPQGIGPLTRRTFLKCGAALASVLALPAAVARELAEALASAPRQPLIWLSFQECTGCTESLTRSHAPSIEALLFDLISLDYHHTLQAASGQAAEAARERAMTDCYGRYLLAVDGAVPLAHGGACSTSAGRSNLDLIAECAQGAAAIVAVGTCAAFGGLPAAVPNPTGAVSVGGLMDRELIPRRPLVNISGCPPIPVVIGAVLAHYLAFRAFPELDAVGRPRAYYGDTVHDRCPRLSHFQQKQFAKRFDDDGARSGWCLFELGCKGPVTGNACATLRWNQGVSFPMHSGHPCLGCAEPNFWDRWGFYQRLVLDEDMEQAVSDPGVSPGELLFDNNCAYCHAPRPFRTEVGEIPQLLRSESISAHRFSFTDEQLRSLVDYLKSLAP